MIVNFLKVVGINVCDLLNEIHREPFDPFTRDGYPFTNEPLNKKAERAERAMKDFEITPGLYQYTLPAQGGAIDLGDQALWQGVYTMAIACKYGVTKDSKDAETLGRAVSVMAFHQPGGRLIRGLVPGTSTIQDDASNDTATGHLAGLHFAAKYGDDYSKNLAAALLDRWARGIRANGGCLMGPDGAPTTYGSLLSGFLTDPLRLTLYLAITRAAGLLDAYSAALKAYRPLVRYPKVKLWGLDHDYDTHRATLHLSILCDLETDPAIRADYIAGLVRIWKMARTSANPWTGFLVGRHAPDAIAGDMRSLNTILREYDVDRKLEGNVERVNSKDETLWASRGVRFTLWNEKLRSSQPLPPHCRPNQDFFWQRNQFDVDGWVGNTAGPSLRYNPGDYLAAWWLGRLMIQEQPVLYFS